VRIGPNEISINDAGAIQPLLHDLSFEKGRWYDIGRADKNGEAIHVIRDNTDHGRRRKLWNTAFTTPALRGYEHALVDRVKQFAALLSDHSATHRSFDIAELLQRFTFDLMGDFSFGGGFEMMAEGGDKTGYTNLIETGMKIMAPLVHIPWILPFLRLLPTPSSADTLWKMGQERMNMRTETSGPFKDVSFYLSEADEESGAPRPSEVVASDACTVIVAGSHTTMITMSIAFYFLLTNPDVYKRLQEEIDAYFPGDEEPIQTARQSEMKYLNAVINETLRLYPALGTGSQRTPCGGTGGAMVSGKFVPEGTYASIATFSLHRDQRYFSPSPDTFIPDRWLPTSSPEPPKLTNVGPERRHNPDAFIPFSAGPANCIGKNLAYQEMRMLLCYVLKYFELEIVAPVEKEGEAKWDEGIEDYLLLVKRPLLVVVRGRGSSKRVKFSL